jgi:hypothetical protein
LGFCLSAAVIAAAIADPIVERASNAGLFGPGSFTDRSNLDVIPALLAGIALLAIFMVRRARAIVSGCAPSNRSVLLLPPIFALQILTLFAMETAEQFVVFGHGLGPLTWLGAPPAISLTAHAAVCIVVTFALVRSRRALAVTTLRVMRLIATIARFVPQNQMPPVTRRFEVRCSKVLMPVLCTIGKRAPPCAAS